MLCVSRRTACALLTSLACAGVAVIIWAVSFRTDVGRTADTAALRGFAELQGTWVATLAQRIADLCNPVPFALLSGVVIVTAFVTRGARGALAVAAILMIPNLLTQLLKSALAEDRVAGVAHGVVRVEPVSWPSGHSTAAMVLVLCAVIAAPAGARRLVAVIGAVFAIAVAYSVVLLGWHFPSDALGGFAVAGVGASLGVAALSAAGDQAAPARRQALVLGLGAAVVAVLGALLARVALELPGREQPAAFLASGAAIVVLGVALAVSVAAGLSRPAATTAPPSRWRRATG